MRNTQELQRLIQEGTSKLTAHQREVSWWLEELRRLNLESTEATKRETDAGKKDPN